MRRLGHRQYCIRICRRWMKRKGITGDEKINLRDRVLEFVCNFIGHTIRAIVSVRSSEMPSHQTRCVHVLPMNELGEERSQRHRKKKKKFPCIIGHLTNISYLFRLNRVVSALLDGARIAHPYNDRTNPRILIVVNASWRFVTYIERWMLPVLQRVQMKSVSGPAGHLASLAEIIDI